MIVEYDQTGRISHVVFDPVPEGFVDLLNENGKTFLNLPPEPLPDLPLFDEEGNQLFDTTYESVLDEDGAQIFADDGSEMVRVIKTPLMDTGRMAYADVDIDRDFVMNGMVLERPKIDLPEEISLAVGETYTVKDLPDPARFFLDREQIQVEGGKLEIEGEMPAEYTIRFDQFPYVPLNVKVTVHEAVA